MDDKSWPLLNDLGVELVTRGGPSVQGFVRKFANLYRSTWERLVPEVQGVLEGRWRSSVDSGTARISLECLRDHVCGIPTFGNYSAPNYFDFNPVIQGWPEGLIETLIAHELAHCFCDHSGNYSEANEDEVDALVESWGFPMRELRKPLEGQSAP